MINNKKGFFAPNVKGQMKILRNIILMLIVVVVVYLVFIGPMREKGKQVAGLYDAGDCDADNVWNAIDRCPCLSTGGLEDNKLRGCPLGTTFEEANRDKQTCGWFATGEQSCGGLGSTVCYEKDGVAFVSSCSGKNKEKCIEKEEGGYKKRCDLVSETAIGVPLEEAGLAGKWDLVVTKFTIPDSKKDADSENDGEIEVDLKSISNSHPANIKIKIKNQGEQNIPKPFLVSVYVCNENKKESSCTEISNKQLNPLDANKEKPYDLGTVDIGTDGDACDGEGDTRCFIRVKVDSKNALQELDETNNDAWFFVWLKNKKMEKVDWQKRASIEIYANAGEDKDYQSVIETVCEGFMGGGNGDDPETKPNCDTQDDDCDDEGETLLKLPPQGCLVHASENSGGVFDWDENDCGWAQAEIGFVLPHRSSKEIDIIGSVHDLDGTGTKDLFTYKWQALPTGSLLCGDDQYWCLCDDPREEKVLLVGGKRFKCKDRAWSVIP